MARQLSYDFTQLTNGWAATAFRKIAKDGHEYTVDGSFSAAKGATREQAAQHYADAVAQIEACAKPDAWESKMAEALAEKFEDGLEVGAERLAQNGVLVTEGGLRCEGGVFLSFEWLRKVLGATEEATHKKA